ncbi:MAG: hypothetical protein CMP95_01280 [Gammaproteobacteria bacterium]|nr:hypothetical protein [Gammaproteobacteria bacterium]
MIKPLHYYLIATGSWFLAYGIQGVMFAWFVTIVLRESPSMVGIAHMTLLAPATVLVLIGGSLADQFGGKPIAIIGQSLAVVCVLFLALVIYFDYFSYPILLVFAFALGCAQAIVTPARDGLLPLVASGRIQRTVVQSTITQFGIMMLGFVIASFADKSGALIILSIQVAVLLFGIVAILKIKVNSSQSPESDYNLMKQIRLSIYTGMQTVLGNPVLRAILLINFAMGLFFMSSYMVTIPLLLREVYGGSSSQLSWINLANCLGLVLMMFYLLRMGDLKRQGRGLLLSHGIGAIALAGVVLGTGFISLIVGVFVWGLAGGLSVTASRSIAQELSPPSQRGRVMAFFSFSFMAAGPIGALFSGFMSGWLGPEIALLCSAFAMLIVVIAVSICSSLWNLGINEEITKY